MRSKLRIMFMPTYKHSHTPSHDVKPSLLFFGQATVLLGNGRRWWSFLFLWGAPGDGGRHWAFSRWASYEGRSLCGGSACWVASRELRFRGTRRWARCSWCILFGQLPLLVHICFCGQKERWRGGDIELLLTQMEAGLYFLFDCEFVVNELKGEIVI